MYLIEYSICPTFLGKGIRPAGLATLLQARVRSSLQYTRYSTIGHSNAVRTFEVAMGPPSGQGKTRKTSPSEAILCSLLAEAAWTEKPRRDATKLATG